MKYLLGTLGFIILAVVAIILIASTPGGRGTNTQEGERKLTLTDYIDDDSTVVFTEQGRIVGDNEHAGIRISVNRSERRIQILRGYEEVIEREQAFPNTPDGYDSFIRALTNAGFSRERDTDQKDSRGTCPLGRRQLYDLRVGADELQHLWSTACRDQEGTFGGNDGLVRELFQKQITDYNKFVAGVRL